MKMFFVEAKPGADPWTRRWPRECCLMRMRISTGELPLIAFQSRQLGEQFLACTAGAEKLQLTENEALDPQTHEQLLGCPLFLFQDPLMMEEIQRRGAGFPFCEFVTEYGDESWVLQ